MFDPRICNFRSVDNLKLVLSQRMIKHVIKGMINGNIKAKRDNMVIHEMLGTGMTSCRGKFPEIDYVPLGNYLCYGLEGFWLVALPYKIMSPERDTILA